MKNPDCIEKGIAHLFINDKCSKCKMSIDKIKKWNCHGCTGNLFDNKQDMIDHCDAMHGGVILIK